MNTTTVGNSNTMPSVMPFWDMVKDMDNNWKLELVSMLINSMRLRPKANDDEERELGFRNLAGCWVNDHGDDDMETIIREGRKDRKGNRVIPSFDE